MILERVHDTVIVDAWFPEHGLAMPDTVVRVVDGGWGDTIIPSQIRDLALALAATVTHHEFRVQQSHPNAFID